ncbi:hypothetical protein [Streptomyces sp. NPDC058426]|uniref:hypothetical protein n=1 Tax=Streptomyces sp. NPDC058426 TaxID=3346493 RepID=UPI003666739A
MASDDAVLGCTGAVVVATRGSAGPGEVLAEVRGGRELFLAWSEAPIPRGTRVLVVGSRGTRQIDVVPWEDPLDGLLGPHP